MVEVLKSAVVGELSAWQTKWETNGESFFYKYKDKDKDKDKEKIKIKMKMKIKIK